MTKMIKNIVKSLIATLQMMFGYYLFAAILNLALPKGTGHIKIAIFGAFLICVNLSEHPTSVYNPFAFSLRFRTWIHVLFGTGGGNNSYKEPEPIQKIQEPPKQDEQRKADKDEK